MKASLIGGIVLVIASTGWGYSSALGTNASLSVARSGEQTSEMEVVSFQKDVNPILQHNCSVCHAPGGVGYAKSGFNVQSYRAVMKGTRFGAVVVPGSSTSSNLVWLLKHGASSSINMPKMYEMKVLSQNKYVVVPTQAQWLSPHDVWLISGWIDQGAKDN